MPLPHTLGSFIAQNNTNHTIHSWSQTFAQIHAQVAAGQAAVQTAAAGANANDPLTWHDPQAGIDDLFEIPEGVDEGNQLHGFFQAVSPNKAKRSVKPMTDPNAPKKVFQELYSYPSLKLEKTKCKQWEHMNPLKSLAYPWCSTYGIVGIEVEVENIVNHVPLECYWMAKSDGSLRNNGIEYVSIPLQIKQVQSALEHLYKAINHHNNPDFSNRTSIHVHLNCRDLTQDQLWVLCVLYCLFEKHFYAFAGTKRLNSIFCVPVYRSNILGKLEPSINNLVSDWQKYCGLNILPMFQNNVTGTYGTIEFRHLSGTNDPYVVMKWIDNIMALRKAALQISKDELIDMIKDMNTTSSYKFLYSRLFCESDRLLTTKKDFEECVSHTKREIFGNDYGKTITSTDQAVYWKMAGQLGIRG